MKTMMTVATAALAATMLMSAPAFAKGGDGGEGRAKLKAELAETRAKQGATGPSLFDRLFGGEPERADGEATRQTQ